MNEAPELPAAPAEPVRPGSIVLGITFIILWGLAHVVLLGLSFAGGLLLEILLGIFKNVTLPGLVINNPGTEMAWIIPLQIGIALTGLAGLPAGLAMFWRHHRKRLWFSFSGLLALGLAFDLYAIYRLFADSFKGL